ncbi:hypothetical protein Cme02nite_32820 [Catellatospora methionotrophica]|uniref:Uncharacterized protein n=1 Tax=Catellatospora methionotrophica TaxID=121620 RepID=A0A8J3LI71_9ACTN|nr:hypothetical protein [Catellatospora methionotrophica]GIG14950.1 hypothetical protein Cme02nite_32820 [Catellatospora methionotrophica]
MAEQRGEDERGLDRNLAALADHGARIGRLSGAEQARHRGAQRRRNGRLAAAASGLAVVAVFAGVYVTQFGQGSPELTPATERPRPVVSASASPSASPSPVVTPKVDPSAVPGDGVPNRDQAVWLQATTTGGYPLLTVLPDRSLSAVGEQSATDDAQFALIPLTPEGEEYFLKTAQPGTSGELGCAVRDGDRFTVTACDGSRREQRVVLRGTAAPYEVVLGGQALKVTGTGVTGVALGQGTPLTFIIRGEVHDPTR